MPLPDFYYFVKPAAEISLKREERHLPEICAKSIACMQLNRQKRPSVKQNAQHKVLNPPALRSKDPLQFSRKSSQL
jgi:hypothetical protein